MKRTFRYVSILVIVALLTIIVMKNGAIASTEPNIIVNNSVSVGDTISIRIEMPEGVTSYSGGAIYFYTSNTGTEEKIPSINIEDSLGTVQTVINKVATAPSERCTMYMVVKFNQIFSSGSASGEEYTSDRIIINVLGENQEQTIGLTADSQTVEVGGTVQTHVTPQNASVTYASENGNIATVNASGVITGVSEGTTRITATSTENTSKSASVSIQVVAATVQPPEPVEDKTPSLNTNYEELEAHGNKVTITSDIPVTWTSSNSSIATVESVNETQGRITSTDNFGECEITAIAKTGGKTAKVRVVVTDKVAENKVPAIFPSMNIKLDIGDEISCAADTDVTWSSSNSEVASINQNSGLLKANSEGSTVITARSNKNGKSASITVSVVKVEENNGDIGGDNQGTGNGENNNGEENNDQSSNGAQGNAKFAITPSKNQTLKVGSTLKLTANKPIASCQSSKSSVATVSNDGIIKAVAPGTATISVMAADSSIAQIKIAVSNDGSVVSAANNGNAASQAGEDVPATGESSAGTLIILGIVTLMVATVVFRKKTK